MLFCCAVEVNTDETFCKIIDTQLRRCVHVRSFDDRTHGTEQNAIKSLILY